MTLESGYSDDVLAVRECDRVVIMVWRRRPDAGDIERSADLLHAIATRLSRPISVLAVIEPSSGPPALDVLVASARGFDRSAEAIVAIAAVLEERAATSMVLDAAARVMVLRRRASPSKFCADAREAVAWVATRHPHGSPGEAFRARVLAAVEQVRALP